MNSQTAAAYSIEPDPKLDLQEIARTMKEFKRNHPPPDDIRHLFLSEETLESLRRQAGQYAIPDAAQCRVSNICGIAFHTGRDCAERMVKAYERAWKCGETSLYETNDGEFVKVTSRTTRETFEHVLYRQVNQKSDCYPYPGG